MSYSDDDEMVDETIEEYNDEGFDDDDEEELPPPPTSTRVRPPTATRRREPSPSRSPVPVVEGSRVISGDSPRDASNAVAATVELTAPADEENYSDDAIEEDDMIPNATALATAAPPEVAADENEYSSDDPIEDANPALAAPPTLEQDNNVVSSHPDMMEAKRTLQAASTPLATAEQWSEDTVRTTVLLPDCERYERLLLKHVTILGAPPDRKDDPRSRDGDKQSGFRAIIHLLISRPVASSGGIAEPPQKVAADFVSLTMLVLRGCVDETDGSDRYNLAHFISDKLGSNGDDCGADVAEISWFLCELARVASSSALFATSDRWRILQAVCGVALASAASTDSIVLEVLSGLLAAWTTLGVADDGLTSGGFDDGAVCTDSIGRFIQAILEMDTTHRSVTLPQACGVAVVNSCGQMLARGHELPLSLACWILRVAVPIALQLLGEVDLAQTACETGNSLDCLPQLMQHLNVFLASICHEADRSEGWSECCGMTTAAISELRQSLPDRFILRGATVKPLVRWIECARRTSSSQQLSQQQQSALCTILSVFPCDEIEGSNSLNLIAIVAFLVREWLVPTATSSKALTLNNKEKQETLNFQATCGEQCTRILLAVTRNVPCSNDAAEVAAAVLERIFGPLLGALLLVQQQQQHSNDSTGVLGVLSMVMIRMGELMDLLLRATDFSLITTSESAASYANMALSLLRAAQILVSSQPSLSDESVSSSVLLSVTRGAALVEGRCFTTISQASASFQDENVAAVLKVIAEELCIAPQTTTTLSNAKRIQSTLHEGATTGNVGIVREAVSRMLAAVSSAYTSRNSPKSSEGVLELASRLFLQLLDDESGGRGFSSMIPIGSISNLMRHSFRQVVLHVPSVKRLQELLDRLNIFAPVTLMKSAWTSNAATSANPLVKNDDDENSNSLVVSGPFDLLVRLLEIAASCPIGIAYLRRVEMERVLVTTLRDASPVLKQAITATTTTTTTTRKESLAHRLCLTLEALVFAEPLRNPKSEDDDEHDEDNDIDDAERIQRTFLLLWKRDKFVLGMLRAGDSNKLLELLSSGTIRTTAVIAAPKSISVCSAEQPMPLESTAAAAAAQGESRAPDLPLDQQIHPRGLGSSITSLDGLNTNHDETMTRISPATPTSTSDGGIISRTSSTRRKVVLVSNEEEATRPIVSPAPSTPAAAAAAAVAEVPPLAPSQPVPMEVGSAHEVGSLLHIIPDDGTFVTKLVADELVEEGEQSFFCGNGHSRFQPRLSVTEASGHFDGPISVQDSGGAGCGAVSRTQSMKSSVDQGYLSTENRSSPTLSPRFMLDSAAASVLHTPRRKSEAAHRATARQSILNEMAGKEGDYPPTAELEYQLRSLVDDLRLKPEDDKSLSSHLNLFRKRSGSLDNVAKWMVQREIKRLQSMKDAVFLVIKAIRARDDVLDQIHTFVAKYERNPEFYAEGTCDGILTELLRRIRECTVAVNESIAAWKMTQKLSKQHTGHLMSPRKDPAAAANNKASSGNTLGVKKDLNSNLPSPRALAAAESTAVFLYNGVDYSTKMQFDLQFLYQSSVQKFICVDLDYQTFLQQKRRYSGAVISEEEFRTRNFFSRLSAPKGTLPVSREAGSLDPDEVDFKIQELAVDFHKGNNVRFRNAVAGHVNVLRRIVGRGGPGSPLMRGNASFTNGSMAGHAAAAALHGRSSSVTFANNASLAGSSCGGDDSRGAASTYRPVKIDPHGHLHDCIASIHRGSVLVDTETRMIRRNPLDRFTQVDRAARRLTRETLFKRRANSVVMMKKLQERSMQSQTSTRAQNVAHMLAVRNTSQRWWSVVFMICLVDIFYQRLRDNMFQTRAARAIQRWFRIVVRRTKYGKYIQSQIIRMVPSMAEFYVHNQPSIISDVTRLFVISTRKATIIQNFIRNRRSRRRLFDLIIKMRAAIHMQRQFRRRQFRRQIIRYLTLRVAARRILRAVLWWKQRQERKRMNLHRNKAIRIQRWYRIRKAMEHVGMLKERQFAVISIQKWRRGTQGCRRAEAARHVRQVDRHLQYTVARRICLVRGLRHAAAMHIQCLWRQISSRRLVAKLASLKRSNLRIYLRVDETTAQRKAIAHIMAMYRGGRVRRDLCGAIVSAPQPGDAYYLEEAGAAPGGDGRKPPSGALTANKKANKMQQSPLFQERTRHLIQTLLREYTPVVSVLQKAVRMLLAKRQLQCLRREKLCRRNHFLAWIVSARRLRQFRHACALKAKDQFIVCLQRAIYKNLELERLAREAAARELMRRHASAAIIQALYRGWTTRLDFRDSRALQRAALEKMHEENLLVSAAVTIQTRMRLYLVKMRILEQLKSRRARAASCIQRAWRKVLELRVEAEKKHQWKVKRALAAIAIQTAWRCYVEYRQEKMLVLEDSM